MKSFVFAWVVLLAPVRMALCQEAAPPDTAVFQVPSQPAAPTDWPAEFPKSGAAPSDTGTAVIQSQPETSPDTAAVPPRPDSIPPGTGTLAPPPQENVPPADTATVPPLEKSPPSDTGAAAPQPGLPPDTGTAAPAKETVPPAPNEIDQEAAAETQDVKPNRVGFGIVFNDEAPVSIRAWFNPTVGLDAGVGLRGRRVEDSSTISDSTPAPTKRVSLLDLSFDLGIPIRVFRREGVDFIMRPGFGFRARPSFEVDPEDPTVRSIETTIELEVNGSIGVEYYPTNKVSFSLSAGLALVAERTGGKISNSIVRLETLPSGKGVNFAFRYYAF